MNKITSFFKKFIVYFFLIAAVVATIYPLYWMLYAGTFKSTELVNFIFEWLPGTNLVENFKEIQASFDIIKVIWNTVFVSVLGTTLSLIVNLMMGYALAKYEFKYKKLIFNIFVVTMFVGGAAAMIPQFEIINKLKLYNSLYAIILPAIYSTYNVFLARQTLMDFPTEILQSGRIDGCGEFKMFWRLVVPNVKPIIVTIGLITFMGYWNGYLWNLIVTNTTDKFTLQVALASIYPKSGIWTYAHIKMLGATISIIPIFVLFISMQKHFVNSLTGAVKG